MPGLCRNCEPSSQVGGEEARADGTAVVFLVVGALGLGVLVLATVVGELDLGFDGDEGAAEAAAILARGHAEAKSMDARSEAFATYGEAAILEMLVKVLPDVVGAAAAPLSAVDKMTVISTDGAGSLAGRSRRTSPRACSCPAI